MTALLLGIGLFTGVEMCVIVGVAVGVGAEEFLCGGGADSGNCGAPKYCLVTIGTYPISRPAGGATSNPESKLTNEPEVGFFITWTYAHSF